MASRDFTKMTMAELRGYAKSRHILPIPRKKPELIRKLQEFDTSNSNSPNKENSSTKSNSRKRAYDALDNDNNNKEKSESKSKSKEKSKEKSESDDNVAPAKKKRKVKKQEKEEESKQHELVESNDDPDDEAEDECKQSKVTSKSKSKSKSGDSSNLLKIVCFNLNGVRAAAKKGLEQIIKDENADIVCFSEMKCEFKLNPCKFSGYEIIWYDCSEKKGYAGTAIISKIKPLNITKGIGCEDGQGRAIILEYNKFYLVNTYVPNSGQNLKFKDRRQKWDIKMKSYLKELQNKKPVIWTGDLNVAIEDYDVYDGETNPRRAKTAGFTPYERKSFRDLLNDLKMVDSYRSLYPDARGEAYTFWTARSRGKNMKEENLGWRLDYFVVSQDIVPLIDDIIVKKDVACSDHVPLILTLKNPDTNL